MINKRISKISSVITVTTKLPLGFPVVIYCDEEHWATTLSLLWAGVIFTTMGGLYDSIKMGRTFFGQIPYLNDSQGQYILFQGQYISF